MATVHPHPHIFPGDEEGIAVMAVLPAELNVNPNPLPHGNPPGKFHVAVALCGGM